VTALRSSSESEIQMSASGNAQIGPDEPTQTGESRKVRTLHEPPDIWELVHETRVEFKPGSTFASRLKAHPLAIALVLLIIGGGAVFGFMKLRGGSESQMAAPTVQKPESSNPKIVLSPQSTESSRTTTVSAQPSKSAPVPVEPEARKIEEPKPVTAVPAAPPESEAPAKPRRDPTIAITAKGATVAATRPKDKARPATVSKAATATVTRTEHKNVSQGSTLLAPKSDKEKGTDSTAAKKQPDKSLSSQPISPAKSSPTPKGKVINWP
jgi:cytoskeletal protein RodZ